jgi:tRNA threonylcarbamoyl adenosine modification protein YjeE
MIDLELPTEADTVALANRVAPLLRTGDILALYGTLGAGKTFFTRELCRALGSPDPVNSPTFVIRNDYDAPCPIRHFDLYRMSSESDVAELGLDEDFEHTITIVEWPELAEFLFPPDTIRLTFSYRGEGRSVRIGGRIAEELG